jgi:branched-chain amino acid aminotransferase
VKDSQKTASLKVDLNGQIVPKEDARVSVFDRGFLYGDGVFETLRVYNGHVFLQDAHWERLQRSASLIRLEIPFTENEYNERLDRVVEVNGLMEAVARVTVSRGVGEGSFTLDYDQHPTTVFSARPFDGYPEKYYRDGVAIILAKTQRLDPAALSPAAKSANYLNSVLAKAEADDAGAFDAVMLNAEGFLTEGSVTNLFMARDEQLLTPSIESGILPGITRATVIELARGVGLEPTETALRPEDLLRSDEAFLTNTTVEVLPVARIGDAQIGAGRPGKITRELHEAYRGLANQECCAK